MLPAAVITIDSFTTPTSVSDTTADGVAVVGAAQTNASFLGTRTVSAFLGPQISGSASPSTISSIGISFGSLQTPNGFQGYGAFNYAISPSYSFATPVVNFSILANTDANSPNRASITLTVNGVSQTQFLSSTADTLLTFSNFAGITSASTINLQINALDPGADVTLSNFRVTTVPEPGTYAMIGAGIGALALLRRRKA